MKRKTLACLLLCALLLSACGAKSYNSAGAQSPAYMPEELEYENSYSMSADKASGTGNSSASLPENRKWIVTMDISAETDDLDAALAAVSSQLAELEGYVESQQIDNGSRYSSRRYRSASLTLRIPAEKADSFVAVLSGCTNVISNSKNVRDITLTYTATESRITALKTEEARLLELLAEAENMSDLLEIESRLTDVRYELENTTSQLRRYDNQVDYATVSLYLSQVEEYTPVEKQGFLQRISEGFKRSLGDLGEGLVDFAVLVIVDLPYIVLWGIIGTGVYFLVKHLRRKKKITSAPRKEK